MNKVIDADDLMLDAAYIAKGFFANVDLKALERTERSKDGGEINLVSWMIHFAHEIELVWLVSEKDPVGAWCYEVAEPFGKYLAKYVNVHGEFPSVHDARRAAHEYAWEALKEDA